ncbi:MAG: GAF domain-containing protein [Candidatus Bipolaricaulia bacterium]
MNRVVDEIQKAISGATDFTEAAQQAVERLRDRVAHYNWVGIYMVDGDELALLAWDGPEATEHTRIQIGQGICGLAAERGEMVIVDDVDRDPRYIACFPSTKSEIVVPIIADDRVIGEIDIDSDSPAAFENEDDRLLNEVARALADRFTQ